MVPAGEKDEIAIENISNSLKLFHYFDKGKYALTGCLIEGMKVPCLRSQTANGGVFNGGTILTR